MPARLGCFMTGGKAALGLQAVSSALCRRLGWSSRALHMVEMLRWVASFWLTTALRQDSSGVRSKLRLAKPFMSPDMARRLGCDLRSVRAIQSGLGVGGAMKTHHRVIGARPRTRA